MSDRYTESARGQECQIRIPGRCTFNTEQTVPAHLNGAGLAIKRSSVHIAYSCMVCHDICDGRITVPEFSDCEIKLMHHEGVIRTQIIMIASGVLKL